MNFNKKNILILGLAKTGVDTIKYLNKLGANIVVNDVKTEEDLSKVLEILKDINNIQYILGQHITGIYNFDLAVISPGIPTDLPFIVDLKNNGVEIIGEVELGYRLSVAKTEESNFIGITGTNGKTTTTSLIGAILKNDNKDTHIAGNIGNPVINTVELSSKDSFIVTELSSFQLETIDEFKPKISVFLNISEDHLNRHHTLENYIQAKANIFKNQTDKEFAILNYDDPKVRALAENCNANIIFFSRKSKLNKGIYLNESNEIVININEEIVLMHKDEINLPGNHNIENSMAAIACAYLSDVNIDTIRTTLKTFNPIEHRQEVVKTINGVTFINDSKGTNPESTTKAVESYKEGIILILGGRNKDSDFNELLDIAKKRTRAIVLRGECANELFNLALEKDFRVIAKASSVASAVETAYNISRNGDIVLFSPACASWDMYNNYEERGNDFKENVHKLSGSVQSR